MEESKGQGNKEGRNGREEKRELREKRVGRGNAEGRQKKVGDENKGGWLLQNNERGRKKGTKKWKRDKNDWEEEKKKEGRTKK